MASDQDNDIVADILEHQANRLDNAADLAKTLTSKPGYFERQIVGLKNHAKNLRGVALRLRLGVDVTSRDPYAAAADAARASEA